MFCAVSVELIARPGQPDAVAANKASPLTMLGSGPNKSVAHACKHGMSIKIITFPLA